MRRTVPLAAALLAAGLVAGCGVRGSSGSAPPAPRVTRTLTVSAAASLTDVFNGLKKTFEQQNPGTEVRLNYGGSFDLAQQIVDGSPADVYAAANTFAMELVSKAGLVNGRPTGFVTNTLQIAVAPGDPKGIHSLADLTRPDVKVVVCAHLVPCGTATEQVERLSGITLMPASRQFDAPAALTEVAAGDADATLVYRTTVRSSPGKVDGIDFPEATKAATVYPIATLKSAPAPDLAAKWVALVDGPEGKKALRDAGFGTP